MTRNDPQPTPVPRLNGLPLYEPPPPSECIDLDLSRNEGGRQSNALLAALEPSAVRCYPSRAALERTLADRLELGPEQVLVTAGADEALNRVSRAFLEPGREIVVPVPTFEMVIRYAELTGATIIRVPWLEGRFPVDAVLAASGPATAVIAVVSPNNPTGAIACADDLKQLAEGAPQAVLVLDHAYAEFADEDLTGPALQLPNAVVVRSLSKAWGLAGLRVGYALGPRRLIHPMRVAGSPFSVAGPSLALAAHALESSDCADLYVRRVREERTQLVRLAGELGIDALPSQGNFVLLRGLDAAAFRGALAEGGILVRSYPKSEFLADCVRITCPGDPAAFARLEATLRAVAAGGQPTALPPRGRSGGH